MTDAEIEAALAIAFSQCEAAGIPLKGQQKAILLQVMARILRNSTANTNGESRSNPSNDSTPNPLEDLTQSQRQALLQFIQERDTQTYPWKIQLLNDWLQGQDSGSVQFVREELGLQWLEQVQPVHIAQYTDKLNLKLKVGDRIEVSNSLWEWVQDDGPCCREWYPCTVVAIAEETFDAATEDSDQDDSSLSTSCTVRFDNGSEYEIQAIYSWNQYQWRWASA
ncbi:hypothetical protein H6G89_24605 [Oscillatoria sp. FACHB-1407]|uniref:hypothetical protein n=1 Tax=Oscillatoria sp. FACHB-1407 TaxID=2692847 RepID=UPI0016862118|nr:hypothetical protein [Oscillatoria sp. FACHB-1407]MBD2464188.1 hypothetical protein [Oscillatoria sp. FACHB-1407]